MHDIVHLVLRRLCHSRVPVSGAVYRHTPIEIQVGVAFLVIQMHAFCPLRNEIISLIGLHHILPYDVFQFLRR